MSAIDRRLAGLSSRRVADGPRLLALVMGLPLLDGLFPALLLAGALDSPAGVLEVGVLVFAGSATIAVILGKMADGNAVKTVALVGVPLVALAACEAAVAPALVHVVDLGRFHRFAGLVVLTIAAATASPRLGEVLPRPAVIVAFGLVASVDVGATPPTPTIRADLVFNGAAAAAVGVVTALAIAAAAPTLRSLVDRRRFRWGSAVALASLGLSILGFVPQGPPIPLAVLVAAGLLSLDVGGAGGDHVGSSSTAGAVAPADEGPADQPPEDDLRARVPWVET